MIRFRTKKWLQLLAAWGVLAGGFCVGAGLYKVSANFKLRNRYTDSVVEWRQDLAEGAEEREVRDRKNRTLAENMKYVSINRELLLADGGAETKADIAVDERSAFSCTVTILRDATGEALYRSGVIDPGHYITTIRLETTLSKGYYPCTAVWSYYAEEDEYVGETAWNLVVVIDR